MIPVMIQQGISARDYTGEDRAACLALLDGNTPDFFDPAERTEYSQFLDHPPCPYLVVSSVDAGVVGAGGYYVTEDPCLGALAWGLVARAWHRRGIGRELLQLRLSHLRVSGVGAVRVRTSQRSRGFFERAGFRVVRIVPQGLTPGIDMVELRLALHAA